MKEWERGPVIGRGSFGTVHLAQLSLAANAGEASPEFMAVKSCPLSQSSSLLREKFFLEQLAGRPEIISCYGGAATSATYNLFLEYLPGGSLAELRRRRHLSPEEIRRLTASLLFGVHRIHAAGIVHCDLKPQNLLFSSSGDLKIADFGLSKFSGDPEKPPRYSSSSSSYSSSSRVSFKSSPLPLRVSSSFSPPTRVSFSSSPPPTSRVYSSSSSSRVYFKSSSLSSSSRVSSSYYPPHSRVSSSLSSSRNSLNSSSLSSSSRVSSSLSSSRVSLNSSSPSSSSRVSFASPPPHSRLYSSGFSYLRGTPLYMAPESVLKGEYEPPADIWALGCVVAEIAAGETPWRSSKATNMESLLFLLSSGDFSPEIPEELPEEGKDFLRRCFMQNPRKRWTAEMLLQHPFVESFFSSPAASPKSVFEFPPEPEKKVPFKSFSRIAGDQLPEISSSPTSTRSLGELAAGSILWPRWDSFEDTLWLMVREEY